ncbi:MAG TPA: beta-propeller domain-containing protein, partial [Acidimicrobiales bacterium]|nr:beta-propeller domain-containing protein [Acidimicrobiales bacterium]
MGRTGLIARLTGVRRPSTTLASVAVAALAVAGGGATWAMSGGRASPPLRVARPPTTTTSPPTTSVPVPPPSSTTTTSAPPPPAVPRTAAPVVLVRYGGCDRLLASVKAEALHEVGPYGLSTSQPGYAYPAAPAGGASAAGGSAAGGPSAAGAAAPAPGPGGAPDYSGANNQEAGVDEPDVVKTDGRLMVVLRRGPVGIQVVDVGSGGPRLDGFLGLPQVGPDAQLFLSGGYAVVVGQDQSATPTSGTTTDAVVVSLADVDHPAVARTFRLQGRQAGARLLSGRVVLVLQGQPDLRFVQPSDQSTRAQAKATQENEAIIERSTAADWLPSVSVMPAGVNRSAQCEAALHPTVASGLDTVSVVSLDPGSDRPGDEVTVVGDASTVYASTSSLYVATTSWGEQTAAGTAAPPPGAGPPPPPDFTTDIHGFDLSDPADPRYLGSGTVPGTLIGQYAMSEYAGALRVATTVGLPSPPPGEGDAPQQLSASGVTVLAPVDGALVAVGRIDGLGQGEKIYAVRYVGPFAYVVTFRQT